VPSSLLELDFSVSLFSLFHLSSNYRFNFAGIGLGNFEEDALGSLRHS
jgi:hypothetical protein